MSAKQETRPVGQPGGPCGKVSGLHFQYSTNRPPHQNPGAILAPMLSIAERHPHGKRDERIGAALLALLWHWEAEQ